MEKAAKRRKFFGAMIALAFIFCAANIASGDAFLISKTRAEFKTDSAQNRVEPSLFYSVKHDRNYDSFGTTASESSVAPESAAGLRTAQEAGITANQARRIQNAANKTKQRITVVGSRAKGTAGPDSDWDYIVSGPSRARGKAKNSVPRGHSGGEYDYSGKPGIDWWQDYNPDAPNYNPLDPKRPHVIFEPGG